MIRKPVLMMLVVGLALACASCSHHQSRKNCLAGSTSSRKVSSSSTQKGTSRVLRNQKPATRFRLFTGKQQPTRRPNRKPNNIQSCNPLNGCRSDARPVDQASPMQETAGSGAKWA